MKVKLQVAAFVMAVVGSAVAGIWLAVHFKDPGWLVLCIPAFALMMA